MRRSLFFAAVTALGATVATTGVARADEGDLLPLPPAEQPDPRGAEPPVMVMSPPPPEAGAPAPAPVLRAVDTLHDGGVELTLGTLLLRPALGGALFAGSGTPAGGSQRESFRHRGRELGLDSPLMWGGELGLYYQRRYFAIGLTGFVAGNPGGADATPVPSYSPASSQVNPGGIVGYGGGLDVAAALPLGPLAFRAGGVVGLRGFSLPMTGFEKKECHGKGNRTYPCDEDATTGALLFFEPRVRMEITPGKSGDRGVVFGGYVGMGVVGGFAPTLGLFVGYATPHDKLQP